MKKDTLTIDNLPQKDDGRLGRLDENTLGYYRKASAIVCENNSTNVEGRG